MKRILISILLLFLFVSCGNGESSSEDFDLQRVEIGHAKGFAIFNGDGYKVVEVVNPWDSTKLLAKYILVSKDAALPKNMPKGVVVRTPIENFVVNTVVDGSVVDILGCADDISAVCEAKYFKLPSIRKGIDSGEIVDLGRSLMPSIEKIVAVAPDAIFATAFQNRGYGAVEKLQIPIIQGASYMETAQLGQSEWIKFIAAFLEKDQLADSIFSGIEDRYNKAKDIVKGVKDRHSVLVGKRFGSQWHVPSGESYRARMFRDAAASYMWYETTGGGSLTLSFEEVFSKARDVDVWMINYDDPHGNMTYSRLKKEYSHYADFSAFKNKTIYGCNSAKVNYYESMIFSPDLLLKDYIKMLYPDLCEDFEFTYFQPLLVENM